MTARTLLALALSLAVTCQQASAQTIEGTVAHVVDGDTFDFRSARIRICGIDAPERGEPGYLEATTALASLISGRHVRCVPVGAGSVCDGRSKPFSRKRVVAQCFVDGQDIAAQMVRSGHACDWVKFSGGSYPGGCRE